MRHHALPKDAGHPSFGWPIADYHKWFAWLPVDTYDRGWRWLCFVERRRVQKYDGLDGGPMRWWQYRANGQDKNGPGT